MGGFLKMLIVVLTFIYLFCGFVILPTAINVLSSISLLALHFF